MKAFRAMRISHNSTYRATERTPSTKRQTRQRGEKPGRTLSNTKDTMVCNSKDSRTVTNAMVAYTSTTSARSISNEHVRTGTCSTNSTGNGYVVSVPSAGDARAIFGAPFFLFLSRVGAVAFRRGSKNASTNGDDHGGHFSLAHDAQHTLFMSHHDIQSIQQ